MNNQGFQNQGAAPDAFNAYLYGNYRCEVKIVGITDEFECPLFVLDVFLNLCNAKTHFPIENERGKAFSLSLCLFQPVAVRLRHFDSF